MSHYGQEAHDNSLGVSVTWFLDQHWEWDLYHDHVLWYHPQLCPWNSSSRLCRSTRTRQACISLIRSRRPFVEWKIQKDQVTSITTDGAANIRNAVQQVLRVPWLYCIAHIINRLIRNGLESDALNSLIKKAKKISRFFCSSPKATRMLATKQATLYLQVLWLKMDNKTRWGSAFAVVDCLLKLRSAISACLALPWNTCRHVGIYHSEGRSPPRLVVHFESEDLQIECGLPSRWHAWSPEGRERILVAGEASYHGPRVAHHQSHASSSPETWGITWWMLRASFRGPIQDGGLPSSREDAQQRRELI